MGKTLHTPRPCCPTAPSQGLTCWPPEVPHPAGQAAPARAARSCSLTASTGEAGSHPGAGPVSPLPTGSGPTAYSGTARGSAASPRSGRGRRAGVHEAAASVSEASGAHAAQQPSSPFAGQPGPPPHPDTWAHRPKPRASWKRTGTPGSFPQSEIPTVPACRWCMWGLEHRERAGHRWLADLGSNPLHHLPGDLTEPISPDTRCCEDGPLGKHPDMMLPRPGAQGWPWPGLRRCPALSGGRHSALSPRPPAASVLQEEGAEARPRGRVQADSRDRDGGAGRERCGVGGP